MVAASPRRLTPEDWRTSSSPDGDPCDERNNRKPDDASTMSTPATYSVGRCQDGIETDARRRYRDKTHRCPLRTTSRPSRTYYFRARYRRTREGPCRSRGLQLTDSGRRLVAHVAVRHRRSLFLLRDVGDQGSGSQDHRRDGSGILQGRPGDLGRIDDAFGVHVHGGVG